MSTEFRLAPLSRPKLGAHPSCGVRTVLLGALLDTKGCEQAGVRYQEERQQVPRPQRNRKHGTPLPRLEEEFELTQREPRLEWYVVLLIGIEVAFTSYEHFYWLQ
jgi:hypothetical protein